MSKGYVAGRAEYRYPGIGEPLPPGGAKVLLLTRGGVCVSGPWTHDGRYVAWAPLPARDKAKEAALVDLLKSEGNDGSLQEPHA